MDDKLPCPNAKDEWATFSVCGCAKSNDGHCEYCCRPLNEHGGSDYIKRLLGELYARLADSKEG